MALFGRKRRSGGSDDVTSADADGQATGRPGDGDEFGEEAAAVAAPRANGPYDRSEFGDPDGRLDLGSIWVLPIDALQLQLDVNETGLATKLTAVLAGSSMEMNAFAAPRSSGIWQEIREEISTSVTSQGGSVEELTGPAGTELLARIPRRGADGRTVYQPARFLGYDGPRWFLRGVLTGPAATDETAATALMSLFLSTVVVRGDEAMAPREALPLRVPHESSPQPQPAEPSESRFGPLERGPEITEIH